jgi:hypothetical protein
MEEKSNIQDFGGRAGRKQTPRNIYLVVRRQCKKLILEKQDRAIWIAFICLRIWIRAGPL